MRDWSRHSSRRQGSVLPAVVPLTDPDASSMEWQTGFSDGIEGRRSDRMRFVDLQDRINYHNGWTSGTAERSNRRELAGNTEAMGWVANRGVVIVSTG